MRGFCRIRTQRTAYLAELPVKSFPSCRSSLPFLLPVNATVISSRCIPLKPPSYPLVICIKNIIHCNHKDLRKNACNEPLSLHKMQLPGKKDEK